MKKYIVLIIAILLIIVIVVVLRNNRTQMKAEELLSESSIEIIPVYTEQVSLQKLADKIQLTGILKPKRDLIVISQTQGLVIRMNIKNGDFVREGTEIIKIDDELLSAELKVTQANFEKAQKDIERFEKMAEIDGVTQDQLEKMQLNLKNAEARYIATRKRFRDTSIKAPFSGYINQLFTKKGSMLGPGVPVFEIVDISGFKMQLKCSEDQISKIQKNMQAHVIVKAVEGVDLYGKVSSVSVSADMSQQYSLEIEIGQHSSDLVKGGMIAVAEIIGSDSTKAVMIHHDRIMARNGFNYVFRVDDNIAYLSEVNTGTSSGEMIEIVEGLSPGDIIVSVGLEKLSDGQKVKIVSR